MLTLIVQMLGQAIPESVLQSIPPDAPLPFHNVPETLRQDLDQSPLPNYVFEVMARFPVTGIPQGGMQGMPLDLPALIAELDRSRPSR